MLRDGHKGASVKGTEKQGKAEGLHLRDLLLDGHLAKQVGDPFISRVQRILVDGGAVGLTGGCADDRCEHNEQSEIWPMRRTKELTLFRQGTSWLGRGSRRRRGRAETQESW